MIYSTQIKALLILGYSGLALSILNIPSTLAAAPTDTGLLAKGGVVVKDDTSEQSKSGTSRVQAKIIIPHPPERVWQVVSDPQDVVKEERKVKKVVLMGKQQAQYTVAFSPLLPTFQYVLHLENTEPSMVRFHRVSGSFKDFDGSWQLTPLEGGKKTLLTYNLALDPGMLCPRFLVMQAVKSDLPTMLMNVRRHINQRFGG